MAMLDDPGKKQPTNVGRIALERLVGIVIKCSLLQSVLGGGGGGGEEVSLNGTAGFK